MLRVPAENAGSAAGHVRQYAIEARSHLGAAAASGEAGIAGYGFQAAQAQPRRIGADDSQARRYPVGSYHQAVVVHLLSYLCRFAARGGAEIEDALPGCRRQKGDRQRGVDVLDLKKAVGEGRGVEQPVRRRHCRAAR